MLRAMTLTLALTAAMGNSASAASRCGTTNTDWIVLDQYVKVVYEPNSIKRQEYLESLTLAGFCSDDNTRLGSSYGYITVDGEIAFGPYGPAERKLKVSTLARLSSSGARLDSTSLCRANVSNPGTDAAVFQVFKGFAAVGLHDNKTDAAMNLAMLVETGQCD